MTMKKTIFILMAVLLVLCACQKPVPSATEKEKTYDLSQLRFDFTIEMPEATKGVRQGWQDGDKVFIFIQGINSAYLTVTHDGSAWSADPTQIVRDGESAPTLAERGYLTAVYLPYGNSLAPVWDGDANAWTFSDTNPIDYYYLKSEKTAYFITDMANPLPTLGAYLYMDTADGFVQFFLPDESASGSIQLACNVVAPCGIAGVALDGTVTEASLPMGNWITARAETLGGEKGYYASGKLSPRPGSQYYFAIHAGDNYKHYYKQRSSSLSSRGAYQLPAATDWLAVSSSTFVEVADNSWATMNTGASTPWEIGTQYDSSSMSDAITSDTLLPSDDDWNLLLDRTKVIWVQLSLLGTDGFLVMNRHDPGKYFFLPCLDYWSTSVTESTQHYMKTDAEGTHEIVDTNPPANAYVRLVSSLYGGNFNPPENGGNI